MLQILKALQLMKQQYTEKVAEVWKSSTTILLALCLLFLPVLFMINRKTKLHLFEPFANSKFLEESAQNMSTHLLELGIAQNTTTSVGGRQNISSTPPGISNIPVDQNRPLLEDDVLVSGFDRESCLSRHQAPSYRKTKPYKRSSYLTSKLRSYQELHTRCGPHSTSYKRTMKKLSRSNRVNETMPCNYLVWTAANGLGNRMVSIASAFLFALFKKRVLLVEFDTEMDDLFCEPFPNSTWLLPHNFPHKERRWNDLPSFKSRVNAGDDHGFSPPFLHLDLLHGEIGDPNLHHFHCKETQSILEKIPAIILSSDQYYLPLLFMNPSFKEELNRMFPEKESVFHHLGHYLFNPSNEAWGLITRFYRAYLSKADEKIGIQIRYFSYHPQQVPHEIIMSQILSCTQNHNILPSLVDTNKSLNVLSTNETSKSKAVLIASLFPEFAEKLRTMYWTRPTTNGDVIGVYQPSHEEYQKFKDNMHNMKAWAEIYLLSLCDVILTSPQSTFGYVAQSLAGLNPWIMSRLGSEELQNLSCEQGSSMEPCLHIPPKYDCEGKTKIDNFTALSSNLMRCEDVPWGIKLVDP